MLPCRGNRTVTIDSDGDNDGRGIGCADLRDADLRGADLSRVRMCEGTRGGEGEDCRLLTREEVRDVAHANLDGAVPPAL
jgi:uncharacterized protein YjbI with pentapeptide repeats